MTRHTTTLGSSIFNVLFFCFFFLKIILYSIPFPYHLRRDLYGRHGKMDDYRYSLSIFQQHVEPYLSFSQQAGLSLLEIGPGDSCLTIIHALNAGFKRLTLIDKDISSVKNSLKLLEDYSLASRVLSKDCYLVSSSFGSITVFILEHSFDSPLVLESSQYTHVFSNAVLQHFDVNALHNLSNFLESHLLSGGYASFQVRFTDHILPLSIQGFYHHTIPDCVWYSSFIKSLPFWTNRLRLPSFVDLFSKDIYTISTGLIPLSMSTHSSRILLHKNNA